MDDFEQKLIKQGMTDEDFLEYEKLLLHLRIRPQIVWYKKTTDHFQICDLWAFYS